MMVLTWEEEKKWLLERECGAGYLSSSMATTNNPCRDYVTTRSTELVVQNLLAAMDGCITTCPVFVSASNPRPRNHPIRRIILRARVPRKGSIRRHA
jgi:hypothetical protein